MKERPILYSTPMAQAKRAGIKTQTRRIMKVQPDNDCYFQIKVLKNLIGNSACLIDYNQGDLNTYLRCPYGKPGDILWGRETWYWDGQTKWSDIDPIGMWWYKATSPEDHCPKWKPSIHMPKICAQLWDRITDIRVERLQDISEADAIAEGVIKYPEGPNLFKNYLNDDICTTAKESYKTLWESINGIGSWEISPWVWVIISKILSTTGRPEDL